MTNENNPEIPYGFCQCGCGQETERLRFGSVRDGTIAGQPRKYISGHKRHYSDSSRQRISESKRKLFNGEYVNGTPSPTYVSWYEMIKRCLNPKCKHFAYYGGRGIRVHQRWIDSFVNFRSDMGECPKGLTIERIDNDGNYEPSNCKWATRKEQANNMRSNCRVEYEGRLLTIAQLAEEIRMERATLYRRLIIEGMDVNEAISRPLMLSGRHFNRRGSDGV